METNKKKTVTDGDIFLPALNTQTGDAPKSPLATRKQKNGIHLK